MKDKAIVRGYIECSPTRLLKKKLTKIAIESGVVVYSARTGFMPKLVTFSGQGELEKIKLFHDKMEAYLKESKFKDSCLIMEDDSDELDISCGFSVTD